MGESMRWELDPALEPQPLDVSIFFAMGPQPDRCATASGA